MIRTTTAARAGDMFAANVLMRPRAPRYVSRGFPGPFSLKGVVEGEAVWTVEGRRFRVTPGVWLLLDRGQAYDIEVDTLEPSQTFVIFFADALHAEVASTRLRPLTALIDDPDARTPAELTITDRLWPDAPGLAAAAGRAMAAMDEQADDGRWDALLRGVLDACADLVARTETEAARIAAARPATRAELHRRLLRGRACLEDALTAPFDLTAAAREACLAPHHFHRTFRAAFDETPYRFVARRRLELARRLLARTDLPVAEVCAEVGYESLPSFTSAFRRAVGRTPAAYRAGIRNGG